MKNYKTPILFVLIMIAIFALLFAIENSAHAINFDFFDATWSFDRAIIRLADGSSISGKVKKWKDYEGSDQLQIEFEDGITYLVHSSDCTLIAE